MEGNSMKIQSISGEELGYVGAICLAPSAGSRSREAMRESWLSEFAGLEE